MSRNKHFNQVSFHPRASILPHPDTLREHYGSEKASDSDLSARYLIERTVEGAYKMNPFVDKPNKSNAYNGYLDNEALLIREDPTYRPARSASSLRAAALDNIGHIREDNEWSSCGKEIPEGTGYCRNGVC